VDEREKNVRELLKTDFDRDQIAKTAAEKYSNHTMCRYYLDTYLAMNGDL
jgi:hypothetical protein